jgi:hypothetical protein
MAHISSIGAAIYTDVSFSNHNATPVPATYDQAGFDARFATEDTSAPFAAAANTFVRVPNVREFPAMGTPANIVKVPVFGAKQSQQIQGQADAPTLELTINYVPSEWTPAADANPSLGKFVNDGITRAFRFALLNALPTSFITGTVGPCIGGTTVLPVQNSFYYFMGRMEALLVKPSLTDATTATLTLSMQSDFYGAYTITTLT